MTLMVGHYNLIKEVDSFMRFNRMTVLNLSITLTLLGGLLVGCSQEGQTAKENEISSIKVMHYDESSFYQQYGMLFSAIYPEVEIEVISTQSLYNQQNTDMKKAMEDFIAEQKPDVLMLGTQDYQRMAEEGKLYNLEAFIEKDKFDLEGFIPGIIDLIREQSDGVLYGLAPSFYSQAVFYNKDLFIKHGVDLPKDKMSWEELLQLAARFPTEGEKEERVYGLKAGYNTQLFDFGLNIGSSMGLKFVNANTMDMTINTDGWKSAFGAADTAIKSGSLYVEDPNGMMSESSTYESYLLRDPFISGRLAMTMESNYYIDQLKQAKDTLNEKVIQNWDLVTVPVNPQQPDVSNMMSISEFFAIHAQSTNPEAAWKFISYINGDEFARVTSKVRNGGFPTRVKYMQSEEGLNLAAFYSLKPSDSSIYMDFEKLPEAFSMKIYGLMQGEMQGVVDGKVSISDALDNIQAQGQALLLEEKGKVDEPVENKTGQEDSTKAESEPSEQSIDNALSSQASIVN